MTVSVGDKAPSFDLPTDGGGRLKMSALKGKTVVLFFYPKASTPGCTNEAKDFTELSKQFEKAGAVILGASKDSVKRQDNFKAKNDLPFPLLADKDHEVAEPYGVWQLKKFMGREFMGVVRTTFIIDRDGKISHVFEGVKPAGHSEEVLQILG